MKKIKEIDQEIDQLLKEWEKCEAKNRPRIKSKIEFCRQCKLYIETNPRPDYLIKQR